MRHFSSSAVRCARFVVVAGRGFGLGTGSSAIGHEVCRDALRRTVTGLPGLRSAWELDRARASSASPVRHVTGFKSRSASRLATSRAAKGKRQCAADDAPGESQRASSRTMDRCVSNSTTEPPATVETPDASGGDR